MQTRLRSPQSPVAPLPHERANVFHVTFFGTGSCVGTQPVSFTMSGPIEIDATHGPPSQSCPTSTALFVVQPPSQPAGGSNGVCGVLGSVSAQLAALAVTVAGKPQVPAGGSHWHLPHGLGDVSGSAYPW